MNDVKWQRKSAVSLLKQQIQECKQMQDFLELEKSQLKRVAQQMENEWQHDRSRLEKDKRKLQKAQQFYAKLCNNKLALKKKLAEKEALKEKMKCELQELNYQVLSLTNEIQIEKTRVAEMEAACAQASCVDADCEMQLLKEVGGQLEQASDEVLIAKERIKRSAQELRYLICQLTETGGKAPIMSSDEEASTQRECRKKLFDHFHSHLESSPLSNKHNVGESLWTLCQHVLGAEDMCLQRHRCHKCDLPRNLPEKLPYEVESSTQTHILHGEPQFKKNLKSKVPCTKTLGHGDCKVVPKATNNEPGREILTNIKRYISQSDQMTSCNIRSVPSENHSIPSHQELFVPCIETGSRNLKPIIEESQVSLEEVKPTFLKLQLSPRFELSTTRSEQVLSSSTSKPQERIAKTQPRTAKLVAVCDTSLQCSSEPASEQGACSRSASSSEIPYTYTASPTPRISHFVPVTFNEQDFRRSPMDEECETVMRTPPLRQPIQLTICQQFYQPLRPICPPAPFAGPSSSAPTETLFFREPMPHLTAFQSAELVDVCIGTSPIQSPTNDAKRLTDRTCLTQQRPDLQQMPLIYQAELACSSDSSRSQTKTTPTQTSQLSPIRVWPFLTPQYQTHLDGSCSSSNSDLESIEIVEIGPETTPPPMQQRSKKFTPHEPETNRSQVSYNSDVDAM